MGKQGIILSRSMTIDEFNKLLRDTLLMEPLTEFEEPKGEMDHEMKEGLARIYGDKGARKYLERAINVAIHNAAMSSGDEETRGIFKGRALTLKELLAKSKKAFESYEKLKPKGRTQ